MKTSGTPEQILKYKIKFDGSKINPSKITLSTPETPPPGGNPCEEISNIGSNDTVNDALDQSDCFVEDPGLYIDFYGVTLSTQMTLTIKMQSTAFTPLFGLFSEAGELIAESTGAPITENLSPGNYLILATSSDTNQTGSYTLTTNDDGDDDGGGPDPDIPQNLIGLTLILTQNNGYETQYYFSTNKNGLMKDRLGVSTDIIYAYYVTGAEIQNENEAIISYSYGSGKLYDAKILLTYENSTSGIYTRTDESPFGLITTTGNFNLYGE